MNISASYHARVRLGERLKCSPEKAMKVIRKAWASTEVSMEMMHKEYFRKRKPTHAYRSYLGFVFVFDCKYQGAAHCITVINPREV